MVCCLYVFPHCLCMFSYLIICNQIPRMPQVVALSKLIYEKLQSMFFLANSLKHFLFSLPSVANWRNVPLEAYIKVYRVLPLYSRGHDSIKLSSDSTGTRTQNLQFRRLLLYPIELWNQIHLLLQSGGDTVAYSPWAINIA